MPTEAQSMLLEGFDALLETDGVSVTASNGESILVLRNTLGAQDVDWSAGDNQRSNVSIESKAADVVRAGIKPGAILTVAGGVAKYRIIHSSLVDHRSVYSFVAEQL